MQYLVNHIKYSKDTLLKQASEKVNDSTVAAWEKEVWLFILEWFNKEEFVVGHTSGSTGAPKQLQLQKAAMTHSAQKTLQFLNLLPYNTALLCLPTSYIAGKMMIVRALVGGLDLVLTEPKSDLSNADLGQIDFAALVPMQVTKLLDSSIDISRFKKLIIGGGKLSADVSKKLKSVNSLIYETYGMTETVSHVAMKQISGESDTCFNALPEVAFELDSRNCLVISAPGIVIEKVVTNDIVELINKHQFNYIGRVDNVINSGGVKVSAEIVEDLLKVSIKEEFYISYVKDAVLGQKVVVVFLKSFISKLAFLDKVKELSRFQQPKEIFYVDAFPYTHTGKIDRLKLVEIISNLEGENILK